MREITDHKLNGLNDALNITVLDEPGSGGACHDYVIHEGGVTGAGEGGAVFCQINFQNGPIGEHGVNGISQEALLAIVIDRLRCFQAGPYNNEDNQLALDDVRHALECLQRRTRKRLARGVEGTSEK